MGGDYYDFAVEAGRLRIALGDVSGKGTGAALLMTVLRAAVRANWAEPSLSDAMARINRTVCQNVPSNKYVTFFLAALDPASGRLAFVNAGHNPPLLVRKDGSVERLATGGLVLGLFENVVYEEGSVGIERGDTLVAYSDGVTETWSPEDEEFGEEKLTALVVGEPHARLPGAAGRDPARAGALRGGGARDGRSHARRAQARRGRHEPPRRAPARLRRRPAATGGERALPAAVRLRPLRAAAGGRVVPAGRRLRVARPAA